MAKVHSPEFLKIVSVARSQICETTVSAINARTLAKENFILVDVREDSEWANGRIPNAIHIGKGVIERDIEEKIPNKKSEIVLYCGGGFRSALAALSLQTMGYSNVVSMNGGYSGWIDANFKVDK